LRSYSQSTFDDYSRNAFASFEIQVIDCRTENITILEPDEQLKANLFVNSTSYYNLTLTDKFESSHPDFCPITSFTITEVLDASTLEEVEDTHTYLSMGSSTDVDEYNYWKNLVLNDTTSEKR
jgi:hypothetical protein